MDQADEDKTSSPGFSGDSIPVRQSLEDSSPYQQRSFYRELLLANQRIPTDFPFLESLLKGDDGVNGTAKPLADWTETTGVSSYYRLEDIPNIAPPPLLRDETTKGPQHIIQQQKRVENDAKPSSESMLAQDPSTTLSQQLASASATPTPLSDGLPTLDEEVLMQYRIEAIYQAAAKCEKNTGYNPLKEEQDQSNMVANADSDSSSRLYEPTIPKPKPRKPSDILAKFVHQPQFQIKEPSMPTVHERSKPSLPMYRKPEGPEFCRGVVIDDENDSQQNEGRAAAEEEDGEQTHDETTEMRTSQCMGCQSKLKVPFSTSLMMCPKCSTVSPALTYREG